MFSKSSAKLQATFDFSLAHANIPEQEVLGIFLELVRKTYREENTLSSPILLHQGKQNVN